jgi:hypothetical protein
LQYKKVSDSYYIVATDEDQMDYKQLNTRVSLEVGEALEVLHRKTRLTKAAAVELALRDFIAKYDIIVSQPKVD